MSSAALLAYHEAGHAVVGHRVGAKVETVSLMRHGNYGGHTVLSGLVHPGVEPRITIALAGYWAEICASAVHRFFEDPRQLETRSQEDREEIDRLLESLPEESRDVTREACQNAAIALLKSKWPKVEILAAALLKEQELEGDGLAMLLGS